MLDLREYLTLLKERYPREGQAAYVDARVENVSTQYQEFDENFINADGMSSRELKSPYEEDRPIEEGMVAPTVSAIIRNEQRVVFVGGAGVGKTTALVHEALHCIRRYFKGKKTSIPVLMLLKDINKENALQALIGELAASQEMADALAEGQVTLFLDGYNELEDRFKESLLQDINWFTQTYPDCSVVLSSRKYGYDGMAGFPVYEIQEFSDEEMESYIHQATKSDRLLNILMHKPVHMEICHTPLLLKMVTDVWMQDGNLPAERSALYEMFINHQIGKTVDCKNDRDWLIEAFTCVAFHMRKAGKQTVDLNDMEVLLHVHLGWPALTDGQTEKILRCGLMLMGPGNGMRRRMSFIHETFQEYLSALYAVQVYLETQTFPFNVSNAKWEETLKMAVEKLGAVLDDKAMVQMAAGIQLIFARQSKDHVVDARLVNFIRVMSGAIYGHPVLQRALDGYLLYNMENYIGMLDEEERTLKRFQRLVDAIGEMDDSMAWKTVLGNSRWVEDWLMPVSKKFREPSDYQKARCLLIAMQQTRHKLPCFLGLMMAKKRIQEVFSSPYIVTGMKRGLVKHVRQEDARTIYEHLHELPFLLATKDKEFIKAELEGTWAGHKDTAKAQIDEYDYKLEKSGDIRLLEVYYLILLPWLGVTKLEYTNIVNNLARFSSLQESMMDSEYWQGDSGLTEALYTVPEELWCERYREQIYSQEVSDPFYDKKKWEVHFNFIAREDGVSSLYALKVKNLMDNLETKEPFIRRFGKVPLQKMQYYRMNFVPGNQKKKNKPTRLFTEVFAGVKGIIIVKKRFKALVFVPAEGLQDIGSCYIELDGATYNMKTGQVVYVVQTKNDIEENVTVAGTDLTTPRKCTREQWLEENIFKVPKAQMVAGLKRFKKLFSEDVYLKLGMIGHFPRFIATRLKNSPYLAGLVIREGNACQIAMSDGKLFWYSSKWYDMLHKGDLVVAYRGHLEKIYAVDGDLQKYGYQQGYVIGRSRAGAYVSSLDGRKKFYISDPERKVREYTHVLFYPTVEESKYKKGFYMGYDAHLLPKRQ